MKPDEILALFSLYGCTLWAAGLSAPALAFLGIQLATRDRALQSLCVGQGAVAGVLMGLGIEAELNHSALGVSWIATASKLEASGHSFLYSVPIPLITGLLFSAMSWKIADHLVRTKPTSKNTYFAGLFCVLVASGHLIASLFPAVENHMTQVYFGDLVTLSHDASIRAAFFSGALLLFFIFTARAICRNSVDIALFGRPLNESQPWMERVFSAVTLITLCLSVQYLGFLYTIALLFLPTAILSYDPRAGLWKHVVGSMVLALASSLSGFSVSLLFTRLPTVPGISLCLLVLGTLIVSWSFRGLKRRPQSCWPN